MTPEEQKVWDLLKARHRSSERFEKKLAAAKEALGNSCSHPPEVQVKFVWQHDNGYGRQKLLPGMRCELCGYRKHEYGPEQKGWM